MRRGSTTGSLTWMRLGWVRAAKSHFPFRVLARNGAWGGGQEVPSLQRFPPSSQLQCNKRLPCDLSARGVFFPSRVCRWLAGHLRDGACAEHTRGLACVSGYRVHGGAFRTRGGAQPSCVCARELAFVEETARAEWSAGRTHQEGSGPHPGPCVSAHRNRRDDGDHAGGAVALVVGGRRAHVVGDRHVLLLPPGYPFAEREAG